MKFNYQKICYDLLKDLSERTKNVIIRRFGLETGEKETLGSIGQSYGITRERVRQIENDGLSRIRTKLQKEHEVFQHFTDALESFGKLRKEDLLLSELGGEKFNSQVFFLLSISDNFVRLSEDESFHPLWTTDPGSLESAKETIQDLYNRLQEKRQPLSLEEYSPPVHIQPEALSSYIEASKLIDRGPQDKIGLSDWPEINPRGIKDKAYLVFKREKKPLHFSEVARLIGEDALVQTVHNELIRDSRFVLIGRGIYALAEWGYNPGTVKDIIVKVLKETEKPLSKEEILERVLKERIVKENTVLLNLSNKEHFLKNSQGKYILRDV
jgi:hypothetical protein